MAPLYCPTQARSDCSASRSAWPIAVAVSSGFCSAGRIGIVVTSFGLAPTVEGGVICACAETPENASAAAAIINVAECTDLMTNPGRVIDAQPIKHICLVGNNRAPVQEPRQEIDRPC